MSDALKRVAGISRLPIFPLPLVMMPNELLPLHIFEDRYRQMLIDIEQDGNIFGVTHFEPKESFIERPDVGTVGCAAEIRESEMLGDGRSNILTLGIVRYRLVGYVEELDPYLVGEVEFFEDDKEDSAEIELVADAVFGLFERMATAAFRLSDNRGRLPEIQRTDPEALSFLITAALNFENEKKYQLLEMTSTIDRLSQLRFVMDQVVVKMEESADIHLVSRKNGHGKKKIDL